MTDELYRGLLADFLLEAQERCDRFEELILRGLEEVGPSRGEAFDAAKRELHTLKGNAGMMGLRELQTLAHHLEDRVAALDLERPASADILAELDQFRHAMTATGGADQEQAPRGDAQQIRSVRVSFTALDELVDLLAEMVIFRNRLDDAVGRSVQTNDDLQSAHEALGKTLSVIQDRIMAIRMVPLRTLFARLRRIVHDESTAAGKLADFVASGGDTPMDKALLECAGEALGHLVRNAVVHGIERPDVRIAAGKASHGSVRLIASAQANEVIIDVIDDGSGIDRRAVLRAAEVRGIDVNGIADPVELLFRAGFSTRDQSDLSSGRGVGLGTAADAVERLGGRVSTTTEAGKGTQFRLRLPLNVSIARALILRVDGEEYALPLAAIAETIRFRETDGHVLNHSGVLEWRGGVLPLTDLGCAMGSAAAIRRAGYVVIIEADGKQRGIVVDELTGMREIVVKGLADVGGMPAGVSGATILGDGRVILILDPKSLVGLRPMLHGSLA